MKRNKKQRNWMPPYKAIHIEKIYKPGSTQKTAATTTSMEDNPLGPYGIHIQDISESII